MPTRRRFLAALPAGLLATGYTASAQSNASIILSPAAPQYRPLQEITVQITVQGTGPCHLVVLDGDGIPYVDRTATLPTTFLLGGALGTHTVLLFNPDRQLLAHASLPVDVTTAIRESTGQYQHLLDVLHWTILSDGIHARRLDGRTYTYWADWVLDNTNTLKGMRYLSTDVRPGTEIFARTQRDDGMIWENSVDRTPPETYWDFRFRAGGFSRSVEDGFVGLRRAPVENHVEMYLLEALYLVWQTTGDDAWMQPFLDGGLRAVRYATSDPYRWSTRFGLLKRGLTIDTWDFLAEDEAKLSGGIMQIDLHKTHFGVFFGDNTGLIAGCRNLALMLSHVGRTADATQMRDLAATLEDRLNRISWNGRFYTHWVPEDPTFRPDLGVDTATQVSLSNAYSLNRGIPPAHIPAIVHTYQAIRRQMPATSPGEFFSIFPPFAKGFGQEQRLWDYVNGGVLACTAGELARGALQHGFEAYGIDILQRVHHIAKTHQNLLPGILRGQTPERPPTRFTPLDLTTLANCDTGAGAPATPASPAVPAWVNEPGNILLDVPTGPQHLRGVLFHLLSPVDNHHRVCLGIAHAAPYAPAIAVPVARSCRSFYLLHAGSGGPLFGKLVILYRDGRRQVEFLQQDTNIGSYWTPEDTQYHLRYGPSGPERMQVGWRGQGGLIANVGLWVTTFTPDHPEAEIASLHFESVENSSRWFILGVTLSDQPAFLPPWTDVSSGMPNNWGAGCVTAALLEGLAGVEDTSSALRTARVSPRWLPTGLAEVEVDVRYPASRGYVSYRYRQQPDRLLLDCTSAADHLTLRVLLPPHRRALQGQLNGQPIALTTETVEQSIYAVATIPHRGVHRLEIPFE